MALTEMRQIMHGDLPVSAWTITPQSYVSRSSAASMKVNFHGRKVSIAGKDVPTSRLLDIGSVATNLTDFTISRRFLESMEN